MNTIGHHFEALQWSIRQFSRGKYLLFLLPGCVFSLLFFLLFNWTGSVLESIPDSDGWWDSFWDNTVYYSVSTLEFIFRQIYLFFVITLLSPLFAYLAEKVDEDLTGTSYSFSFELILKAMIRMIGIVGLAFLAEMILLLIWVIVSWLFNLGSLDGTAYFVISAFFIGFSFYDYALERYQTGILSSFRFAAKQPIIALSSGAFFLVISQIPVIGLAIAPVLMTIITTFVYLKTKGYLNQK